MNTTLLSDTQIAGFDLTSSTTKHLKSKGIDFFDGSLGKITTLKYTYSNELKCLPNLVYPNNFHEYEIAILDLTNQNSVEYDYRVHKREVIDSTSDPHIVCRRPQNIFDPRPLSLMVLTDKFKSNLNNGFLFVCFCGAPKGVTYYFNNSEQGQYSLYNFLNYIPDTIKKTGRRVQICGSDKVMQGFLSKHKTRFLTTPYFIPL